MIILQISVAGVGGWNSEGRTVSTKLKLLELQLSANFIRRRPNEDDLPEGSQVEALTTREQESHE